MSKWINKVRNENLWNKQTKKTTMASILRWVLIKYGHAIFNLRYDARISNLKIA